MTLCVIIDDINETVQEGFSEAVTFLGVKLYSPKVVAPEAGDEFTTMISSQQHIVCVMAADKVRVTEIESVGIIGLFNQWVIANRGNIFPAHMGYVESVLWVWSETRDFRIDPAESWCCAFLAVVAHELHAETDSQDRYSRFKGCLLQRLNPAMFMQ